MSKGSRRKRATRPWQDASAMRNIEDLLAREGASDDSDDEARSRWDADDDDVAARGEQLSDADDSARRPGSSDNPDVRTR